MSDSITISKKHGVNPSINTCFWCGGDKNIILFGKLPNDAEAPRNVCMDYQPCDKCKSQDAFKRIFDGIPDEKIALVTIDMYKQLFNDSH